MVKVGRFFAYFFFFILALVYFTPKVNAYYFLEQELKSYSVVISDEKVKDSGFSLNITDATVSVKSVDGAKVSSADVKIFVFYNSINVKDITLSSIANSFMPLQIQSLSAKYSVFNPLNVVAVCIGDFGEASANINIIDRVVNVKIKPSQSMLKEYKNTLKNLKKSESGEYIYEKNI
jgi:hypothetical protein